MSAVLTLKELQELMDLHGVARQSIDEKVNLLDERAVLKAFSDVSRLRAVLRDALRKLEAS